MARKPFERKDRFYNKAKKEGYPARSAYKIIELDGKYGIFRSSNIVIDLGAAPGGWFKVGQERLGKKGKIIGVDLLPLATPLNDRSIFKQADFTKTETKDWIKKNCEHGADWVISDLSPNISGIKFKDTMASDELARQAYDFAKETLKPSGCFLCKVFPGKELEDFLKELRSHFKKVSTSIPDATRKSSTEVYVIALNPHHK